MNSSSSETVSGMMDRNSPLGLTNGASTSFGAALEQHQFVMSPQLQQQQSSTRFADLDNGDQRLGLDFVAASGPETCRSYNTPLYLQADYSGDNNLLTAQTDSAFGSSMRCDRTPSDAGIRQVFVPGSQVANESLYAGYSGYGAAYATYDYGYSSGKLADLCTIFCQPSVWRV